MALSAGCVEAHPWALAPPLSWLLFLWKFALIPAQCLLVDMACGRRYWWLGPLFYGPVFAVALRQGLVAYANARLLSSGACSR